MGENKIKQADPRVPWDADPLHRWGEADRDTHGIALFDEPMLDELESLDERFSTVGLYGPHGDGGATYGLLVVSFLGERVAVRKLQCEWRLSSVRSKLRLKARFPEFSELPGREAEAFKALLGDEVNSGRLPKASEADPRQLEYIRLFRMKREISARLVTDWLKAQADLVAKDRGLLEELSSLSREELIKRAMAE